MAEDIAALEQQLHAKADAKRGLCQRHEAITKSESLDPPHRVAGCPNTGENNSIRGCDFFSITSNGRAHAETLESIGDRTDIAVGKVDDGEPHRTPLVLGTTSPSVRIASRKARPNALKQASVL